MGMITIIGAGPGISAGVARKFGKEGFNIALVARKEDKLEAQVAALAKDGIRATFAVADVSDFSALQQALTTLRDLNGHSDMILYNASAVDIRDILEQDWETMKRTFEVNVGGVFQLMHAVLPWCLKENKGKLFVTGGGMALKGDPKWTSLSMGKAALRNLMQAYAKRAEGTNVHVSHLIVCGYVQPSDPTYNADAIAAEYWRLFNQKPGAFETEVIY
jgi:short-subunit dehydrogenase